MAAPVLELALETSTRTATVALAPAVEPGAATRVLVEEPLDTGHAHASDLVPAIARALAAASAEPTQVKRVFVGLGPGSYTGLRVAVAAAVGLAIGAEPPELFGVPSAAALLFAMLAPGERGVWLSDARSDTLYALVATRTESALEDHLPLTIIPRDGARALLAEQGAGARTFTDLSSDKALAAVLGDDHGFEARAPRAGDVLALGRALRASGQGPAEAGAIEPLYLRDFQAKVARR